MTCSPCLEGDHASCHHDPCDNYQNCELCVLCDCDHEDEVCHEGVVRGGVFEPCDLPATGHAIDVESIYPACDEHQMDTAAVMLAALDIMHATRAMDPFAGSSVRALTDAEVRWAGLMRDWMTARGIEL